MTLVEQGPKVGFGYEPRTSWPVLQDLDRLGVRLWKKSRITDIHRGGGRWSAPTRGNVTTAEVPCDTLVVASGPSGRFAVRCAEGAGDRGAPDRQRC